jgi:hypothetical protein
MFGRTLLVSLLLLCSRSAELRAQVAVPPDPNPTPYPNQQPWIQTDLPVSGPAALFWGGLGLLQTALTGGWPSTPDSPEPRKSRSGASTREDGRSVDALMLALYSSISHGPGSAPDWKRMRSLFLAGGIIVSPGPPHGSHITVLSVKAFQEQASRAIATMKKRGEPTAVFEREIAQRVFCFGNLCHVLSSYEARHSPSDPAPFSRGVNSLQLAGDGKRWWIASVTWDTERPGNPIPTDAVPAPRVTIPAEYLKRD